MGVGMSFVKGKQIEKLTCFFAIISTVVITGVIQQSWNKIQGYVRYFVASNTTNTLHASWKQVYHTHLVYYSHFSSQVLFVLKVITEHVFFTHFFFSFSYLYLSPVLPMCCSHLLLCNLIFVLCKRSQSLECLKPETSRNCFLRRATFILSYIHLHFCFECYVLYT